MNNVESLSNSLKEKYEKLQDEIRSKGKILIAFSGGVDSALLAKIAYDELGNSAWAVLIDSETVPKFESKNAHDVAKSIGINFAVIRLNQLSDNEFTRNDLDRCYFCRKSMAQHLLKFAHEKSISTVAAGAQVSDLADYRPGIKAFHESNIWHPFIDLKISKGEIRQLAKFLELPVSNKPSMACLSSRIPYGQEITGESLQMIGAAEDYLRELGFSQYRARLHENLIRIEVPPSEFEILMRNRDSILKKMKEIGFTYVSLDLEGFRSGSMNEVIPDEKIIRQTE
ncbi:ATP-dependent sacrificial sulfur transferase LarE [[Eubacterium] cellulosolvens]